jgi:F-type H+-transporting ATPase subunit beta
MRSRVEGPLRQRFALPPPHRFATGRILETIFFVDVRNVAVPVAMVAVEEAVQSFEALAGGELDEVPEQAFFNVGGVESVLAKAKTLQES